MVEHTHAHPLNEGRSAETPFEFWEGLYSGDGPRWSGRANHAIAELVADWQPGRSLDLGCGEGGDVMWLAEQGWRARGLDLSETAVAHARETAVDRGLAQDHAEFEAVDLSVWVDQDPATAEHYDLITASFLQSPVKLPRAEILRAGLDRLAPGGRLVIVAHASAPSFAQDHHSDTDFPSPESEVAMLELDPERHVVDAAEVRTRTGVAPNGQAAEFEDSVVVVRRVG